MKLIPAPARQLRTWSLWLLIAAGLFDLAVVLARTLGDLHVMSTETLAAVNAVLAFATGATRFIQQQIAVTTEEKLDLIEAVSSQPVKPGETNVEVAKVVESTPLPLIDPDHEAKFPGGHA